MTLRKTSQATSHDGCGSAITATDSNGYTVSAAGTGGGGPSAFDAFPPDRIPER